MRLKSEHEAINHQYYHMKTYEDEVDRYEAKNKHQLNKAMKSLSH